MYRPSDGFRRTKIYKEIRKIIIELFGKPDFTDAIVLGVSFKWYLTKEIADKLKTGSFKNVGVHICYLENKISNIINKSIFNSFNLHVEVKFLNYKNWRNIRSFRILVRI